MMANGDGAMLTGRGAPFRFGVGGGGAVTLAQSFGIATHRQLPPHLVSPVIGNTSLPDYSTAYSQVRV